MRPTNRRRFLLAGMVAAAAATVGVRPRAEARYIERTVLANSGWAVLAEDYPVIAVDPASPEGDHTATWERHGNVVTITGRVRV